MNCRDRPLRQMRWRGNLRGLKRAVLALSARSPKERQVIQFIIVVINYGIARNLRMLLEPKANLLTTGLLGQIGNNIGIAYAPIAGTK